MSFTLRKEYYSRFTFEQWKLWEGLWEIIEGLPYPLSHLKSVRHQIVNGEILSELQIHFRRNKLYASFMPVDWKISDDTIVVPDAIVVSKHELGDFIAITPAIVFEVISASTESKDRELKYRIYEQQKVRYYVIVDPKKNLAEIYQLCEKGFELKKKTRDEKFFFELEQYNFEFNFNNIWD
ncbi:MAG TPA: Uma2 family endonuclease [Chitinophagales bacterium]|nr:Uma2 family endonuclease [Chitinophagales bacterium]